VQNCDKFVYLDTVQFSKNSFDNRNRIPKENNYSRWLTIPIKHSGFFQKYLDCHADNIIWTKSHLDILKQNYKDTAYFDKYFPMLQKHYERITPDMNLADINFELLKFFLEAFEIKTEIIRASSLSGIHGKGSQLVLNICKKLKADEYYSGRMGKEYLVVKDFKDANIEVIFQEYEPPTTWSAIHQLFVNGPQL
jgi:hypothetical protein